MQISRACGDGVGNGDSFRADGETKGEIFDIATRENPTLLVDGGCADQKMRIRRVSVFTGFPSEFGEMIPFHVRKVIANDADEKKQMKMSLECMHRKIRCMCVMSHFAGVSGDSVAKEGMRSWISFAALLALLITFRLIGAWQGWMNVSPLPALLLMSLVSFQGRDRWLLPLAAWVISDPLLNAWYGQPFVIWDQLGLLLGLASTLLLVPWMKHAFSWTRACAGSVLAAFLFYFVTNTVSFWGLPEFYERTWSGFYQAQWSGPAGLGPTWVFLRNSVVANLLFTTFFLLALRPLSAYLPTPFIRSAVR